MLETMRPGAGDNRRATRRRALALAWTVAALAAAPRADAVCIPLPCFDCWIDWRSQLNLVVFDRERDEVRLIPNLQFTGESRDFALVVPTPSRPDFELAPATIWNEALAATRPLFLRDTGGCDGGRIVYDGSPPVLFDEGVIVHEERRVGAFDVTVLSSDDPLALVNWLRDHDFALQENDAARFAPFVERAWFFTAMRPDSTDPANVMPPAGWNNSVDPVVVRYASTTFELPLPILAINSARGVTIVLWTVDDHRTTMAGFATDYANRVSDREHAAMRSTYPALAAFVEPGRYLTRLTRSFAGPEEMQRSLLLERAPTDAEHRRTFGAALSGSLPWIVLVLLLAWGRRRSAAGARRYQR